MPKTISNALQGFLLNNGIYGSGFSRADLITITFNNGQSIYVVSGTNTDITMAGSPPEKYYASQYGTWTRGPVTGKADFRPDTNKMTLETLIQPGMLFPGTSTPFISSLVSGRLLMGATVNVQTLFFPKQGEGIRDPHTQFSFVSDFTGSPVTYTTTGVGMGTMTLFNGLVGNVSQTDRSKITMDVYDYLYILNRQMPPFQIQSACRHSLFDAGCTLLASNFTSTAYPLLSTSSTLTLNLNIPAHAQSTPYVKGNLVTVGSTVYFANTSGTSTSPAPSFNSARGAQTVDGGVTWISMNDGYALGKGHFITGQNAGINFAVKIDNDGGSLQLFRTMPFPVATGDQVVILPGCDKTVATCENVYNNLIHIGSQPTVPNPEIAQ